MKLSIITITRNDLEGLKRTAQSIASQSWKDYEWLVIDGASTDGTVDFIRSLERQPDYWVSEPDKGIYDAMNKGIVRSTGEYLLFMNSGDSFYASDTLAQCFSSFPDADVIYGDAFFIYPKRKKKMTYPEQMNLYYFRKRSLCHQATFIRASLLRDSEGYSTNYQIVSDWRQWLVWLIEERTFVHLPVTVCNYMMDGLSTRMCKVSDVEREAVYRDLLPPVFYHLMKAEEELHMQKRRKYLRYCYLLGALSIILIIILVCLCLFQ